MSGSIPSRPTVLDATVLSNFAYLDRVSLLRNLDRPITTPTVRDEIASGTDGYPYLVNATEAFPEPIPVVELDDESTKLTEQFADRLDRGEAEALALAERHRGLVVTDDGVARKVARQRTIQFTGSIGVLMEFVDNDHVAESTADSWLKRLIDDADYYAPSRELTDYR
jgi:predicted nucleic acid-binding protein